MDGLRQLAWVADAIKSPFTSPLPESGSLGTKPPSPPLSGGVAPPVEAGRPLQPRRRNLSRAAEKHGVSGVLSAEAHARALVVLHLHAHDVAREVDIRAACPGRDVSEQLRALVEEGAVGRLGAGVNGDPYRYALAATGEELVHPAREALELDAAAQEELARVVAAAGARKPAKKPTAQVAGPAGQDLPVKRKRKVTEALKENVWAQEEEGKAAAPAPRSGPATGFTAIYRALSRIKSRTRSPRGMGPAPAAPPARVRNLAPPPAALALSWNAHWARTWGSYGHAPRRERRAVGNILVSIADGVGTGAPVTGSDLRRLFPGCPDHSKALTAVINAGWAMRQGAGGRTDPFRYTATAAGVAAAAAARPALAADKAAGR